MGPLTPQEQAIVVWPPWKAYGLLRWPTNSHYRSGLFSQSFRMRTSFLSSGVLFILQSQEGSFSLTNRSQVSIEQRHHPQHCAGGGWEDCCDHGSHDLCTGGELRSVKGSVFIWGGPATHRRTSRLLGSWIPTEVEPGPSASKSVES